MTALLPADDLLPGDDVYPEGVSVPAVDITAQTEAKISRIPGEDSTQISFTSSESFVEYEVKIVPNQGASRIYGTRIEKAVVGYRYGDNVVITDDEMVDAGALEGQNTIKVFVAIPVDQDMAINGNDIFVAEGVSSS